MTVLEGKKSPNVLSFSKLVQTKLIGFYFNAFIVYIGTVRPNGQTKYPSYCPNPISLVCDIIMPLATGILYYL